MFVHFLLHILKKYNFFNYIHRYIFVNIKVDRIFEYNARDFEDRQTDRQ